MTDGRDAGGDREKLSFSELDRRRREKEHGGAAPRGRRAQQEDARASREAIAEADSLFSTGKGGAAGARLEAAVRDSQGTPGLGEACRAYLDGVGAPDDVSLLGVFLDTGDRGLTIVALEALLALANAGSLEIPVGLRSQLRVLEQDRDDTIAGISEELLAG